MDAWTGYRRYRLGIDDEAVSMTRREAEALERDLLAWQDHGG